MKKTAIILLTVLIAGMFVACNQDVTVDAQAYANMEVGTFVLNGQNYSTLQEAVNAKLGKSAKALGNNDGVIYLTRNASGPGAVIDKLVEGGVIIDFAGYTYSFTNVTGLQGGDNPKAETFGLGITSGADVTLRGLQQIDLNDTGTTDLTMVYVAGAKTKLTIENAPKMKVEPNQYVFWAADGATLTIGSTTTTSEKTEITGKIAATGTADKKPVVSFNNDTKINASELKADAAVVVLNTSTDSAIGSFVASNEATVVVCGTGDVVVDKNDSPEDATYEVQNTSSEATVTVKTEEGPDQTLVPGAAEKVIDGKPQVPTDADYVAMIGPTLYDELEDAIKASKAGDTVLLLKNTDLGGKTLEIAAEKVVTLDLNGHVIINSSRAILNKGDLTIADNSDEKSGFIISTTDSAVCGADSYSVTTIESGNFVAREVALFLVRGARATVNGGIFTTVDNFVVGTNGKSGYGKNVITINGGVFNGNIESEGYVACGIYAPNDDVITINGGEFNITNGAGIVARAGNVTVTGGSFTCTGNTTGKVGDSNIVVPCSALVFDSRAGYPGKTDSSMISVSGGEFVCEDNRGSVVFINADEDFNKRIVLTGGTYSSDPADFVAAGYAVEQIEENRWSVFSIAEKYGNLFAGGKGTVEEPFLIYDYDTMQSISKLYDVGYCFYEVALDKTDGKKIDCRADWVSVYLNGSFDGKGVEFVNVDKKLFRTVGKVDGDKATASLFLKNFDVTFDVHVAQGASLIHNLFCKETDFTNVNIHGYLEGGANSAAYYNYGTLNGGLNTKMTVSFHDCDVDATMVSVSGNLGLFSGMCFGGTGENKTTINADGDCEWEGEAYLLPGRKLYRLCGVNAPAYLENNSENSTISTGVYDNLIVKTPAKTDGKYTVEKLEDADYVVVYVNGQFTEHDSVGNQIPNANGITVTLGSFALAWSEVTDNIIFDEITSVDFEAGRELEYKFNEGLLSFSAGGRDEYTSGTISIRACQYNSDNQLISASGELTVVEKKTYNGDWNVK